MQLKPVNIHRFIKPSSLQHDDIHDMLCIDPLHAELRFGHLLDAVSIYGQNTL